MSNWFFEDNKPTPDAPPSQEPDREPDVGGTFECQTCGVYVSRAYIRRGTGDLLWYCPEGHVSAIKEFM